ncbi:bolA-like protein 2 isoform X1 [Dermochelys coriacea]|uniref:bolA-like protein 2 isoform X1 n=1 Tax=Dermochelys coriacea TaxID=27794 RepID=UPI001CA81A24|nr:bolA-like protein 2 isoform X1 [Dermochelys coriacea]
MHRSRVPHLPSCLLPPLLPPAPEPRPGRGTRRLPLIGAFGRRRFPGWILLAISREAPPPSRTLIGGVGASGALGRDLRRKWAGDYRRKWRHQRRKWAGSQRLAERDGGGRTGSKRGDPPGAAAAGAGGGARGW